MSINNEHIINIYIYIYIYINDVDILRGIYIKNIDIVISKYIVKYINNHKYICKEFNYS